MRVFGQMGDHVFPSWSEGNLDREVYSKCKDAAEHGSPSAKMTLGLASYHGDDKLKMTRDLGKAIAFFKEAADKGYAPAMYELGVWYTNEENPEKDEKKSEEWISKAKARGYVPVPFSLKPPILGDTPTDEEVKLAKEAADKGDMAAQWELAEYYRNVVHNDDEAYKLYRRLAYAGFDLAVYILGLVYWQRSDKDINSGCGK